MVQGAALILATVRHRTVPHSCPELAAVLTCRVLHRAQSTTASMPRMACQRQGRASDDQCPVMPPTARGTAAPRQFVGRDAVRVIRARHRFDRRWRKGLWRVWRECPWIVGNRLIRIDRWIVVGVWTWLHHASFLHQARGYPNALFCRDPETLASAQWVESL